MNYSIVIFGASGDLTSRKLVPALYSLFCKERLPENTRVIGFSRTEYTDTAWREALADTTARFLGSSFDREAWLRFAQFVHYQPGDLAEGLDLLALGQRLSELESRAPSTRLYYLSTAPKFYEPAIAGLGAQGLLDESDGGVRRVVVEKPFGTDLASARALNQAVHRVMAERRVFRIDHYLGKETRAKPARASLREYDLRAGLESQLRRPRADHGGRRCGGRQARRLLRHGRACCATCCRTTCCSC